MAAGNLLVTLFVIACMWPSLQAKQCQYDYRGICSKLCPPETVSYLPACSENAMTKRTCRQPVAISLGNMCDLSRCDCVKPKVWDEVAEKCVLLEDCSEQKTPRNY